MAVRRIFLVSVFTSTSNEQARYQIKKAAIERRIKQCWVPDKIVNAGRNQQSVHQPKDSQRQKQLEEDRRKR
ncbi:hypothetical protein UUU_38750 [Klebsiella pneumoniae subsp. pneumoniae DSM 30104 = JCM 1662 = NBRC 14940]|nr:hypothetical protein UUU_38750 [Klebsiella pneumoniae subsp. pneumoniae DSM 30104 = JCM 1662 = NBRC 14940]